MTAELEKYDYKVILSFNSTYERSLLKNLQTLLAARTEAIAFTPLFSNCSMHPAFILCRFWVMPILSLIP